ncbi:hypothetical protein MMC26_002411 [Xylographa opegraphella]|nr:hypothetical protein [Xylographa opegraphella]
MSVMRARRIGDALLRSGPSPLLLSFLAPSVSPLTCASIPLRHPSPSVRLQSLTSLRCLATKTSPLHASTAAASKHDDEDFPQQSQRESTLQGPAKRDAVQSLTASIINSNRPKLRTNSPRVASTYTATVDSSATQQTSADRFRKANQDDQRTRGYLNQHQGRIANALDLGDNSDGRYDIMDQRIGHRADVVPSIRPVPPPIRLDAFIGRSEEVDPDRGLDLGRALKKLETKCSYNNVRGDVARQRFHERPGLKRKRLKSERWRKRFKEGFRAVVAKVQDMRNRGW